jgi:hypothetical protein
MRKLLLLLFLFTLSSNALAEDEKWALVIVNLNPSVMSNEFKDFYPFTMVYNSKKECEDKLLEYQEKDGGTITRNYFGLMVLDIIFPPREDRPQAHQKFTCNQLIIVKSQ